MLRLLSSPSLLAAAVAAALIAAQGARADEQAQQSAPAASATTLQEVVVTAQKRQEKLHDVPMGVTAITADEIDKQRLVDFEDLEAKVAGLSVELIQPGQDRLTLRGENVGSVGSTVATYIDDVPFGSSNALANGSIVSGDFDTWDLQRVEVLRGPQGTLYGAGSEGGLLKYVTNPPDPSRQSASVRARLRGYRARRRRPVGQGHGQHADRQQRRDPHQRLRHLAAGLHRRSESERDQRQSRLSRGRASFPPRRCGRQLQHPAGCFRAEPAHRRYALRGCHRRRGQSARPAGQPAVAARRRLRPGPLHQRGE